MDHVNGSSFEHLTDYMVWKDIQACTMENPQRTYTTCFQWVEPETDSVGAYNPTFNCAEAVAQTLRTTINTQQANAIRTQQAAYRAEYASQCAAYTRITDHLQIKYEINYHHYTLYYYDRAGNLIRTVPPEGVNFPTSPNPPQHRLETKYSYNSIQQLVEQTTPDGGKTRFFYNRAGQLRFSINAKQLTASRFSFTNYDALGRVREVGESNILLPVGSSVQDFVEDPTFPLHERTQVTATHYSDVPGGVFYLGDVSGGGPTHLANRVSWTESEAERGNYAMRTYYSYDPHGNVKWLAQDIPGLGRKYMRYEYDLLSNKVLYVAYQEGQLDAFDHRYGYDADNRLTDVYTSSDGELWDRDAHYAYYAHGPLRRLTLGQDQVQGLDYTYTAQGWLKAINHPSLAPTADPGRDGAVQTPASGVPDAFGMALSYFAGDYRNTASSLDPTHAANATAPLFTPIPTRSLYNGNIATWQSRTQGLASESTPYRPGISEAYTYDQLNRIVASQEHTAAGGVWTGVNSYRTNYTYDANGNLVTLQRRNSNGQVPIDSLLYHYAQITGGHTNKLEWVEERELTSSGNGGVTGEDVGGQAAQNYTYDALGNLTRDIQSDVTITWTVNNKIAKITRTLPNEEGTQTISYRYDAAGNRVTKSVASPFGNHTMYYVRDATGNMMAVYKQHEGDGPIEELMERKGKTGRTPAKPLPRPASLHDAGSAYTPTQEHQQQARSKSAVDQPATANQSPGGGSTLRVPGGPIEPGPSATVIVTQLIEHPIYGSARLGERKPNGGILMNPTTYPAPTPYATRVMGQKSYELNDHLGNVRVVVSDIRESDVNTTTGTPNTLRASLAAYYNYYPFGMMQPGRHNPGNSTASGGYRFGYNGKEKDDNGELGLTNYDYGFRIYNPAIGRFLSLDPLAREFPWWSPYHFAGNTPIKAVDLDGLEVFFPLPPWFEPMIRPGIVPLPPMPGELILPPVRPNVPESFNIGQPKGNYNSSDFDWSQVDQTNPETWPEPPPFFKGDPRVGPRSREKNANRGEKSWFDEEGAEYRPHNNDPNHKPHWDVKKAGNNQEWKNFDEEGYQLDKQGNRYPVTTQTHGTTKSAASDRSKESSNSIFGRVKSIMNKVIDTYKKDAEKRQYNALPSNVKG